MSEKYSSMETILGIDRRNFLRGTCTAVVGGAVLGVPAFGEDERPDGAKKAMPAEPAEVITNLDEFMKVPRAAAAIPGPFPGRVVEVVSPACLNREDQVDAAVVDQMFLTGLKKLTGDGAKSSFRRFFTTGDVVGLKVNPVGAPRISTRLELVESVIRWLVDGGMAKKNIVIWDRFEGMLADAGFTKTNFPGVRIEAMQMMDEEGDSWRTPDGGHVSESRFDQEAYYEAKGIVGKNVRGYKDDDFYHNQHVFTGERSYFGTLVTRDLSKIINLAAFKNTGNGISMATKNLGYGAICNCGRLHKPLFFRVCTHVLAAPWIRDKLVLNVTDGIRGQYDGGPGLNDSFVYAQKSIYLATDPFAVDMVCHQQIVAKRKEMKVKVNEHPRFTAYLHEGESLGLGIADPEKIEHLRVEV